MNNFNYEYLFLNEFNRTDDKDIYRYDIDNSTVLSITKPKYINYIELLPCSLSYDSLILYKKLYLSINELTDDHIKYHFILYYNENTRLYHPANKYQSNPYSSVLTKNIITIRVYDDNFNLINKIYNPLNLEFIINFKK